MLSLLNSLQPRVHANYVFLETWIWMFHYVHARIRVQYQLLSGLNNAPQDCCVQDIIKSMSLPLYQLYTKKYFNNKTKDEIGGLVSNIRNELLKLVTLSEWLDESTRKQAIEKAEAITSYVGYPDALLDDHFLEAYYSKLSVDPQSYLNSMLLLNIFNENQKFSRLHQPSNKVMMVTQSNTMDTNIKYDLIYNTLGIMVATLPKLLFDIDAPKSLNYGGAGMLIANQMIHGLDNEGRKYDKNGNLKNWWTNSTFANYEQKSQCFIKQYEKYNLANLQTKIDGKLTLRENIADNAGVKIAYLAYRALSKGLGPEKNLPGINYTRNQMFWIAFAQLWCTKSQRSYVQPNEHLPEKYRVIGALSNLKEFSEDFKCPINSTMNPSEKCLLW
ncbi:hypothetical protein RI129_004407 [Pyrocoelia pectoralis]|uniref:Uncharacterized protein n=1 Tax=Pyrocoelia pectoralis TaxID=417401 RepID=A0AAN7VGT3_9COLE